MAQSKEDQISGGVYLEDMKPHVPGVQPPGKVKNFSRPFIIPVFDPQGTNSELPPPVTSSQVGPVSSGVSVPNTGNASVSRSTTRDVGPFNGEQAKYGPQPVVRYYSPSSIMSMTPSDLPNASPYRGLSHGQIQELNRVVRHDNGGRVPTPLLDESEDSVGEPPDKGLLAWLHVLAGFLVTLNSHGLNMGFGMFQAYYEKSYLPEETPSKIAWIGSFQIFATFFMCLAASPLLNKGYFRHCFTGGSILIVVGLVLASFCTEWWQLFLAQGVLVGIGMGLAFSAGIVVLTSYFSSNLGIATAISASGSSFGGIMFPLVLKNLLEDIGFGWTMRVLALISFCTLIPANIIARPRPTQKDAPRPAMDWAAFKDLPYLFMMAGLFCSFWGLYFGFYFIASYGQDILHMEPSASINLLVAMNSANYLGRFVPSLISDACIGPINTLIPSVFLAAVMVFLWIGATSPAALFLVGCAYGFIAAGLQSLYPSTVLSFTGADRSKLGSRLGFVLAAVGVGSLTGTPLGGQLISLGNGSYLYAELFAGCSLALGGVFLLTARLLKRGWEPVRV